MSDIRYNQWLHNSGTGGVSQDAGGYIGIGTTAPLIPVGAGNTAILKVGVVTCNSIEVTGNVSVGGTLTYQDVTNIDSVGIITARSDIRGGRNLNVTGITTLSDDVEFVGPTAGITSVTWDKSANSLIFKDNSKAVFGTGSDVSMYNATNFHIEKTGTDGSGIRIHVPTNESIEFQQAQATVMATFTANGSCSLYNNTVKRIETSGIGVTVTGTIDLSAISTTISDTAVILFVYDTR